MDLPSSQEGWPHDKVMSTIQDHALAQWNSNEAAFAISEHITSCEGIYMITHDGRKIMDFNSQAVCTNLGYSCPEIAEAVFDQLKNAVSMAESRWYVTTVRAKVINFLREKMNGLMDRFYFSESGATAVEAAIRIARHYTGRPVVLSSSRSYHGATAGAMTLTGGGDDRHFTSNGGHMENVVHFIDHAPFYLDWGKTEDEAIDRFLVYLEEVILTQGQNRVAAILVETMVGTQGAVPSPAKYLLGLQTLARKYGAVLIVDEVMAGFFRTGKWFSYQRYPGFEPDICTIAKGLTSSYAPMGAVCVTKKIGDHFNKVAVPMGSTYNSHPIGLAAAWAALQLYEKRHIEEHVAEVGPVMTKMLEDLKTGSKNNRVRAVRNTGLHGALEISIPGPAEDADKHNACIAAVNKVMKGRMCTFVKWHRHMRALYIMCNPPLCITKEEIAEAGKILTECVEACNKILA